MLYSLSIGRVHVLDDKQSLARENRKISCKQAQINCRPAFVFSLMGQTGFRQSLHHLTQCNKKPCQTLRRQVFESMHYKLTWLMQEDKILGCVQIQPLLYGTSKVAFQKKDFHAAAFHLAHCPKESCAQLRRAVLLSIRNKISPKNNPRG